MRRRFLGLLGIALLILCLGWIDLVTGYELHFFVFYFVPVGLAAWLLGSEAALISSVACAAVWHYVERGAGHTYSSSFYAHWNTAVRFGSFVAVGWSVSTIGTLLRSEKARAERLQKALDEVRVLEQCLSICCVCKKIRDDEGHWQQMETYVSKHTDTTFSHGYCPECAAKALAEAREVKRAREGRQASPSAG